jgi:hypothetical protein
LGVYKVQGTIKEKFVTNVVQVEMQCRHFYIVHHATKVASAAAVYRVKHEIVNTNMVYSFHFI